MILVANNDELPTHIVIDAFKMYLLHFVDICHCLLHVVYYVCVVIDLEIDII